MKGRLENQLRVLIQRARLAGKEPWKILLSKGLRWALEQECLGQPYYRKTDQGHYFGGLLIVVDQHVVDPIILIKPEPASTPLQTHPKGSKYAVC